MIFTSNKLRTINYHQVTILLYIIAKLIYYPQVTLIYYPQVTLIYYHQVTILLSIRATLIQYCIINLLSASLY
jgi:hypothetical protein